ncbi:MAG: hypothetical protein NTU95_05785 [Methanothrix sp.]|nr:hypothetical protein [Methanothrix sp.]
MPEAKDFSGLVFVKQGRVGSRSEGPDYYLQTKKHEYVLSYKRGSLFEPDPFLESFCGKMVEVIGTQDGNEIKVSSIIKISQPSIPDE